MLSKIFDNATSCSSENSVIIHAAVYDRMLKALRNVRVGNFVALRLLHLLDRPDAGTAD